MSMNDTISDLLTRIRNAQRAHKDDVLIPYSKIKFSICEVLLNEGYITSLDVEGDGIVSKANHVGKRDVL